MKKLILLTLILLIVSGCSDNTVVKVRIIECVQSKYEDSFWNKTTPYTVLERLDTNERVWIPGIHWGATGEVFGIAINRFYQ